MKRRLALAALTAILLGSAAFTGYGAFAQQFRGIPPSEKPPPAPEGPMSVARMDPALDAIIAPNTKVERVATGFNFIEGPVWTDNKLYFSDCRADKLYSMTADGKVTLLLENSGGNFNPDANNQGSNGLEVARGGYILVAQEGIGAIGAMHPKTLQVFPFIWKYQGKRLNSPNDLIYAPDGSLWFTDPDFGLIGPGKPDKELHWNAVFRYANGVLTPMIIDMTLPNGIGFSPDGKLMYVTNYGPDKYIVVYDVGPNGALSNKRDLIPHWVEGQGPDGLKVDSQGNIWASGEGGIRIITPQGKVLGQIKLPEQAANLAFGGPDRRDVYIMGSRSVYRLRSVVPGQKPLYGT